MLGCIVEWCVLWSVVWNGMWSSGMVYVKFGVMWGVVYCCVEQRDVKCVEWYGTNCGVVSDVKFGVVKCGAAYNGVWHEICAIWIGVWCEIGVYCEVWNGVWCEMVRDVVWGGKWSGLVWCVMCNGMMWWWCEMLRVWCDVKKGGVMWNVVVWCGMVCEMCALKCCDASGGEWCAVRCGLLWNGVMWWCGMV